MLTDHLVLRTVDGAADLLAEELRALSSIHSIRQTSGDAVACTLAGPPEELAGCALYSTVEIRDVEQSSRCGLLSTLEPPLRFRVGEPDAARRQEVIAATEQRFGWVNRPADWDVNLEHSADGWIVQFGPLSWGRRFGRPERLPWSTNLIVAEVLVRLAKLRSGHRVLDPFCGTGTILRAVLRHQPTARPIGTDHDRTALELAIRNDPAVQVMHAAAEALPFANRSVDRVLANLPFGKQVGSHRDNQSLYPAVLAELNRVLTADGRAVLLTEDKRLLKAAVDRQRGLKLVRRRLLRYNGATPTVHVLTRTR
ncbi:MAG TPA: methyltransferase domain-containing protein [Kribbella sp.]|nr:methyltransferase domain-containing protein [Kribbella sp.]